MKKVDTREKARIEILNHVIQLFTKVWYGDNRGIVMADQSFHHCDNKPPIGSIVKLFCAPDTKWYLSWVRDKKGEQYLLESIEDGEKCWWSNVGYFYIPLETIDRFPTWKFTDRQHLFKDKWFRACKRCYEYTKAPMLPKFLDNGNVILPVRQKFIDKGVIEKEFKNWKSLKSMDMQAFFKSVDFKDVEPVSS